VTLAGITLTQRDIDNALVELSQATGVELSELIQVSGGLGGDVQAHAAVVAELADVLLPVALAADISDSDRQALAAKGQALPDGSYPIPDAEHLKSAAILCKSGHGDTKAAAALIEKRARELGVPNPLDDSDSVSTTNRMLDEYVTSYPPTRAGVDGVQLTHGRVAPRSTVIRSAYVQGHGGGYEDSRRKPQRLTPAGESEVIRLSGAAVRQQMKTLALATSDSDSPDAPDSRVWPFGDDDSQMELKTLPQGVRHKILSHCHSAWDAWQVSDSTGALAYLEEAARFAKYNVRDGLQGECDAILAALSQAASDVSGDSDDDASGSGTGDAGLTARQRADVLRLSAAAPGRRLTTRGRGDQPPYRQYEPSRRDPMAQTEPPESVMSRHPEFFGNGQIKLSAPGRHPDSGQFIPAAGKNQAVSVAQVAEDDTTDDDGTGTGQDVTETLDGLMRRHPDLFGADGGQGQNSVTVPRSAADRDRSARPTSQDRSLASRQADHGVTYV
jgi:hypothetical protein